MRKLVWIVPLVVVFVFACADRDTQIAGPVTNDTPDIVTTDAGITAEFYNSENAATREQLSNVASNGDVRDAVKTFEVSGYTVDTDNSFFIKGRGPDGSPVEITVLAMGHAVLPQRDAIYLFHVDCVEGRVVVPLRVSFQTNKSDPEVYQIDESTWLSWAGNPSAAPYPPFGADGAPIGAAGLAAQMGIGEWLKCVGERIAAGAVACAMVCRFAPVVYLQCLANCATGHAAYALVSCTIQAL